MPPRKFRLSVHRKNEYRKARAATAPSVSVQHVPVPPGEVHLYEPESVNELKVSVPIEVVYNFEFSSISKLRERVSTLSLLPNGMMCVCVYVFIRHVIYFVFPLRMDCRWQQQ